MAAVESTERRYRTDPGTNESLRTNVGRTTDQPYGPNLASPPRQSYGLDLGPAR